MPDKEMSAEDFENLKELIEDNMDNLARAQSLYRGQTGVNYIPPLRLAPRKRREAADPSIRDRIGRIQNEIEAIDEQAGDAPDAFTDCLACAVRDFEEMLLQIEKYEERVETEDRRILAGLQDYRGVGE